MAIYPSQEWCDEWKNAINNDEAVAKTGKKWGVDFNGNFLFEITKLPSRRLGGYESMQGCWKHSCWRAWDSHACR